MATRIQAAQAPTSQQTSIPTNTLTECNLPECHSPVNVRYLLMLHLRFAWLLLHCYEGFGYILLPSHCDIGFSIYISFTFSWPSYQLSWATPCAQNIDCFVIWSWFWHKLWCIMVSNADYIFAHLTLQWPMKTASVKKWLMMTSSNGNLFLVTGLLCGEFTGHRGLPLTKASDAKLWCFLRSAPEQTIE